jgi:hypothetical protein
MPSVVQYRKKYFTMQQRWMRYTNKKLGGSGHCGHPMVTWLC